MKSLFLLIAILGSLYFLFKKRSFDFFSIAFFSACIYFLPGFVGYVNFPEPKTNLIDGSYLVMILVLGTILFGAFFYDFFVRNKSISKITIKNTDLVLFFLVCFTLTGFLYDLVAVGKAFFIVDKPEMMDYLGRGRIIWATASMVGITASFLRKKKLLFLFFLSFLVFDLYIGFRSSAAIAGISIFLAHLWQIKKTRLIKNYKMILLGALCALFFFAYKGIYWAVKAGEWDIVVDRLTSINYFFSTILNSEPFVIQSNLNEILASNFRVGFSHFANLKNQLIILSPELGAEIVSFNDIFQPKLFPDITFGMASNIWAEMWSVGGFGFLLLFLLFFIFVIIILCYLFRKIKNPELRSIILVLGSYWVFYIHRNSLDYQINLEKRVLFIGIIALFLSLIIQKVVKKIKTEKTGLKISAEK